MVRTVYAHKRNHDNVAHGKAWLKNFAGICVVGYDESDVEVIKGSIQTKIYFSKPEVL